MSEEIQVPAQPQREMDALEIVTLFSADLVPETVEVPGHEGSWVVLQAMDAEDMNRYRATGQKIRVSADGSLGMGADVTTDQEAQEMYLLKHTVKDGRFRRFKQGQLGGEVQAVPVEDRPPSEASKAGAWWDRTFRAMHPTFRRWLVNECKRVNGLRELDLPNFASSSGG